jgi:capreomycidine synthase
MRVAPAPLEDWMREHYFSTTIDLGSSGVPCWTLGELRDRFGLGDDLNAIPLDDSPTFGGHQVRQAIADRCGGGEPEWVMVTHGSSEAIFLIINALLSPGDEIVVAEPAYHSLRSLARSTGCRIRAWPLIHDGETRADLDALDALVGPDTAAVVVNFPHNPTGLSLTPAEQDRLIDLARERGAYLIWDNAFCELTYDRAPLPDPSSRYERCVVTGTMSKAYGLPGLRLGWVLAAPDLLTRLVPLRDALTICMSPLLEHLAAEVLRHADAIVGARLSVAAGNRRQLAAWATANADLVDHRTPDGGVSAFPRLRGHAATDALCRELQRTAGVLLVPGSCFDHPDRVRLGFAADSVAFRRGLDVLTAHLRAPAANS